MVARWWFAGVGCVTLGALQAEVSGCVNGDKDIGGGDLVELGRLGSTTRRGRTRGGEEEFRRGGSALREFGRRHTAATLLSMVDKVVVGRRESD